MKKAKILVYEDFVFFFKVSGGLIDSMTSQRRGSTQSDTSALVSSLTRDPSQSPSAVSTTANTRDLSPSPSCSSLHIRSEGSVASPPDTPKQEGGVSKQTYVYYPYKDHGTIKIMDVCFCSRIPKKVQRKFPKHKRRRVLRARLQL